MEDVPLIDGFGGRVQDLFTSMRSINAWPTGSMRLSGPVV
jgi:hypothetical protein